MDSNPNPNPVMDLPPPIPITTTTTDHLTDPSPAIITTGTTTGTTGTNHSHPPYPEMIVAAISALKDKDGSSRQAISKYIEKEFANLQPTHATLLTHHLKRMKTEGQLIMVKHSYMLPMPSGSTIDFSADNNNNLDISGSGLSKKKPGRPPKLKPVVPGISGGQNQMPDVQVYNANVNANAGVQQQAYQPQFQYNVDGGSGGPDLQVNYGSGLENAAGGVGGPEPLFASLGLGDDGVAVPSPGGAVAKRGRGRPPKSGGGGRGRGGKVQRKEAGAGGEVQGVEKRAGKPGRPKSITAMMAANGLRVKARGRPKRIGVGPVTVPLSGNVLKPRGRPKRLARPNVSVNGVAGEMGLVKKRPGRPPVNKFAKLTGKPMGRPSKSGPGTAVLVTDPRQLVVYQELKNKYELLQSKVKHVATVVKTCIDPTYGNAALGALQELEALAGEANAPSHGQT